MLFLRCDDFGVSPGCFHVLDVAKWYNHVEAAFPHHEGSFRGSDIIDYLAIFDAPLPNFWQ